MKIFEKFVANLLQIFNRTTKLQENSKKLLQSSTNRIEKGYFGLFFYSFKIKSF
jgi:hypothetical protein